MREGRRGRAGREGKKRERREWENVRTLWRERDREWRGRKGARKECGGRGDILTWYRRVDNHHALQGVGRKEEKECAIAMTNRNRI